MRRRCSTRLRSTCLLYIEKMLLPTIARRCYARTRTLRGAAGGFTTAAIFGGSAKQWIRKIVVLDLLVHSTPRLRPGLVPRSADSSCVNVNSCVSSVLLLAVTKQAFKPSQEVRWTDESAVRKVSRSCSHLSVHL